MTILPRKMNLVWMSFQIKDSSYSRFNPLHPLFFDIFISFKTYAIALTSDIKMVFRQISAHEKDRKTLKFLYFAQLCTCFFWHYKLSIFLNGASWKHAKNINLRLIFWIKFLIVYTLIISQVAKAISLRLSTWWRN